MSADEYGRIVDALERNGVSVMPWFLAPALTRSRAAHRVVRPWLERALADGLGGALRLYDSAHPEAAYREVLPAGGTVVCFLSDPVWHEVMPAQRERRSLTGWFRRRT